MIDSNDSIRTKAWPLLALFLVVTHLSVHARHAHFWDCARFLIDVDDISVESLELTEAQLSALDQFPSLERNLKEFLSVRTELEKLPPSFYQKLQHELKNPPFKNPKLGFIRRGLLKYYKAPGVVREPKAYWYGQAIASAAKDSGISLSFEALLFLIRYLEEILPGIVTTPPYQEVFHDYVREERGTLTFSIRGPLAKFSRKHPLILFPSTMKKEKLIKLELFNLAHLLNLADPIRAINTSEGSLQKHRPHYSEVPAKVRKQLALKMSLEEGISILMADFQHYQYLRTSRRPSKTDIETTFKAYLKIRGLSEGLIYPNLAPLVCKLFSNEIFYTQVDNVNARSLEDSLAREYRQKLRDFETLDRANRIKELTRTQKASAPVLSQTEIPPPRASSEHGGTSISRRRQKRRNGATTDIARPEHNPVPQVQVIYTGTDTFRELVRVLAPEEVNAARISKVIESATLREQLSAFSYLNSILSNQPLPKGAIGHLHESQEDIREIRPIGGRSKLRLLVRLDGQRLYLFAAIGNHLKNKRSFESAIRKADETWRTISKP